jgi:3'-phosphoadenosine 5'-phosphosulfate sulfotransferase (PAPS reductase)/FAD synthetase
MNITTLSGGLMSFYSAYLAIQKYGKENILLYFNDTKWEHPDLYRFLSDIKSYLDKEIFFDSDGRNPEQVFFNEHFLGNDRVPLCSRILYAVRLQKYYQDGDNLIFGIGLEEHHRMQRIIAAYQVVYAKTGKYCTLEFPLIDKKKKKSMVKEWFWNTGIRIPKLYFLDFEHNNCSGGCVRQGKKQWLHLLKTLPEIYREREDLEKRFMERFGKGTFLKNTTLEELRKQTKPEIAIDEIGECVGICQFVA